MITPRVLLVEPDPGVRMSLASTAEQAGARVDAQRDHPNGRARLLASPFDVLLVSARLGAYNGLHLVYLAQAEMQRARAIVYTREFDQGFGRDAMRACAFYETLPRLPVTLAGYFAPTLPAADRRELGQPERRASSRGGRRRWDSYLVQPA
jgi:DNA-binding NtrC family response regulator